MLKKSFLFIFTLALLVITQQSDAINAQLNSNKPANTKAATTKAYADYKEVTPLQLVEKPDKYLNKDIWMKAKFDKFSAIGLDYQPTKKDSKTNISILIKRDNVSAYNIPLSELKIIVNRDYAEKELVNLEAGDEIKIYGKVFSSALGDPWVEVHNISIATPKKDTKNKK